MLYVVVLMAFLIGWSVVVYLIPKLLLLSLRKRIVDPVNNRKVHTVVASRLGGFSFFPAIYLAVYLSLSFLYFFDRELFLQGISPMSVLGVSALFIMYAVGAMDDVWDVRYRMKFVFQIFSSILIIMSGTWIKNLYGFCGIEEIPAWIGIVLTILLLVFITNSINFIDGIDGLASILSINALLVYGIMFLINSSLLASIITFGTLGVLIPFFYFNLFGIRKKSHSKIFMGDTGTLVIGFILGVLAVILWNIPPSAKLQDYSYTMAYTMLIIPCFDTIRVCICRIKNNKSLFYPDNNHIHHKLMNIGFSQRQVLILLVLAQLSFLFLNISLTKVLGITSILIINAICAIGLFVLMTKKNRIIKKMKQITLFLFFLVLLTSCSTKRNVAYFQDTVSGMAIHKDAGEYITVKPKDLVYIRFQVKIPSLL